MPNVTTGRRPAVAASAGKFEFVDVHGVQTQRWVPPTVATVEGPLSVVLHPDAGSPMYLAPAEAQELARHLQLHAHAVEEFYRDEEKKVGGT